jgi:hypothetical protein
MTNLQGGRFDPGWVCRHHADTMQTPTVSSELSYLDHDGIYQVEKHCKAASHLRINGGFVCPSMLLHHCPVTR